MQSKEVDVLVIGSGAGGLTAALTAHDNGGDVLVVEKSDQYGGTSATSGGGIWIPCNHLMGAHGQSDSSEAALTYLKACIGDDVSETRLKAYVENAPKMLKYVMDKSYISFISTPYADYFPDLPGGKEGYRTLDPVPMNAAKLGDEFLNMREPHFQTKFGGFTITIPEAQKIITRHKGWQMIIAKQMLAYKLDFPMRRKTKRHRRLTGGNALVGMCLRSTIERGIPIWRNAPMTSLIKEGGQVTGAIIEKDGETISVKARRGVILAAGGFESNQEMREANLAQPTDKSWSATPGTNHGDAHNAAKDINARLTLMDAAWWGPSVHVPGEDRSRVLFAERALPGIYIVNNKGERFLNEAASYDVVGHQLQAHPLDSWIVFDRRAREKYAVGPLYPTSVHPDSKWSKGIKSLVKKADSLEELAAQMGVDSAGLIATAERVKGFSETGNDEDFGKGGNAYDRYYGDPTIQPNPCMAPLAKPPFYAFQIRPGDIGTKGGIDVNENAQALNMRGHAIGGLYAIGNCSSSVMGRTYPGAGSTIGPAMTFGYLAAKHAMGVNA